MTQLWAHQIPAVAYGIEHKSTLLHMWMGCGKSLVALEICRQCGHKRILLLCPKSVVVVWAQEIAKHAPGKWLYAPLHGPTTAKARQLEQLLREGRPVVVGLNYEAAWREPLAKLILNTPWDCLILDESQKIKSPSSRQSRFVMRIKASHKLALTGTPMPSSPLDLYGQFRTLAPWIFGHSFVRFRRRYALLAGPQNNWVVGFKNGPELREKMNRITHHVPKEVLTLPPLTVSARYCTLGVEAQRIYAELETELIADVREGVVTAANAAVKVMRLQQVCAGYARTEEGLDVEVDGSKRELLAEIIEGIDSAEPVVVFARFIHDLSTVRAVAGKLGRRHGEISGAQNDYGAWQRGEVDVLGVQIQAGGLGIDLSRARYCFFYTLMYSLGSYDQAVARLHRPGQKNPVSVYHLVAEGTVDATIRRALEKRRNVIEAILEDFSDERTGHRTAVRGTGHRTAVRATGITEA